MTPVASLDAAMLLAETVEMPLHNLGILTFVPASTPRRSPIAAMRAMIEARLHRVPAFRRRLVEDPLGIGDLRWIDDAEFDLGRHLMHATLTGTRDHAELCTYVGAYAGTLLPRDKPLWEIVLVDGLESGEVVAVTKIHHAAMDGLRLAKLIDDLFDQSPVESYSDAARETFRAEAMPGRVRRAVDAVRTLGQKPRTVVSAARDTMRALMRARSAPRAKPPTPLAVPRTPWSGALSPARAVGFADVALHDVRMIAATFDTSVNDVVLAASAVALQRWLVAHHACPAGALIANVPIAVGGDDGGGNHVSMLRVPLDVNEHDPVALLRGIHATTAREKRAHHARGANPYRRLAELVLALTVPRLLASVVGFYARHRGGDLHPALWNVVISNVPGPREPRYCAGARLSCIHPFGPVQHGSGLNLTVMSTADRLGLGVLACRDRVEDPDTIARDFVEAVDVLHAAASRRDDHTPSTGTP